MPSADVYWKKERKIKFENVLFPLSKRMRLPMGVVDPRGASWGVVNFPEAFLGRLGPSGASCTRLGPPGAPWSAPKPPGASSSAVQPARGSGAGRR